MSERDRAEVDVVIPVFNESENLAELYRRLTAVLTVSSTSHEIIFVNDGSTDGSGATLDGLHESDPRVTVVHLSRNFGHQPAICAGLEHAEARATVVMDGDLQDEPEAIPRLLAAWRSGADVVYAVRSRRQGSLLKRMAYRAFYRLLRWVSELEIPLDSGDFSLMDRRVVVALRSLPERNRFVRGLRAFVGFRQVGVECPRAERFRGRPKYTLRRLVHLALDGLVGFSGRPLLIATYCGLVFAAVSVVLIAWALAGFFVMKTTPPGWASLMIVVLVMASVQLLSLGIIGEYLRRIFLEAKGRPGYITADVRRTGVISTGRDASIPPSGPRPS
ncbi:MAG TPA: glycosyltransferase family 2 protein [Vicinamibacterales bacterium]|jgi:dolichol-phosphate mannosyltransferase